MRKKILSGAILTLTTGLMACYSPKSISQVKRPNITNPNGIYTATLPCADCEGIQTVLKLNNDGSYEREMTYLGKPSRPFRDSGTVQFETEKGLLILQEKANPASQDRFRYQGKTLTQLDGDGKPVTGPLASHFVFYKQASPLLEQYWKLIAIDGRPVSLPASMFREPHIIIKAFDHRVSGNASCNSFFGSYKLSGSQGISFSGMGTTKMACPDMALEDQFLQVLNTVSHFRLQGDTLMLYPATGSASLQFVVAAKH